WATGGITSDFFIVYYPLAALYGIGYGRMSTAVFPLMAIASYVATIGIAGQLTAENAGIMGFRTFWIADTGLLMLLLTGRMQSAEVVSVELYDRVQEQMAELQELHEQIVQSARLAALGELAAKVAH